MDRSNGYESVAHEFLARRGRKHPAGIGAGAVRAWAKSLPSGASVLDIGCGSGFPITEVLINEHLNVWAIDEAPTFVEAFRTNFSSVPVVCQAVEDSDFFGRTFDAVLAWGLIFLLPAEEQRRLLQRVAGILTPGGRLLFTACTGTEPLVWLDAMTGLESRSLGAGEYRRLLQAGGLGEIREYEDEGGNHYFDARKTNSINA